MPELSLDTAGHFNTIGFIYPIKDYNRFCHCHPYINRLIIISRVAHWPQPIVDKFVNGILNLR